MADPGGLFYRPSPPPQTGDFPALRAWCVREFDRISSVMAEGRSQTLRMDVLTEAPDRVFDGLCGYFAQNVVGTTRGLYEYRSGAWVKL
jgi:hypothetical protein